VFERYYRELLSFLSRKVSDRATAADLAQESYARVYEAQRTGSVVRDPRALLYRTARNLVTDHHRRTGVRAGFDGAASADEDAVELDDCIGPSAFEPDAILSSGQGLAAMVATIDKLPPRCREAFVLYKFDGLSYAEVAERMGISVRTVEMQLRIAMEACWACLDETNGGPR
jgi:RNA polymerase sigma-70 factor (ECF subfamily)